MINKNASADSKKGSFISYFRRKQIIEVAAQTIAEQGFNSTSLEDIAANAGISKGVISYHFNNKYNLIKDMTSSLLQQMNQFIKQQVDQGETALEKLHNYINASIEFFCVKRDHFLVIMDVGINNNAREESNPFSPFSYRICRSQIEDIILSGQKSNEFNQLPVKPMAANIQATIDGLGIQYIFTDDKALLLECKKELLKMSRGILPKPIGPREFGGGNYAVINRDPRIEIILDRVDKLEVMLNEMVRLKREDSVKIKGLMQDIKINRSESEDEEDGFFVPKKVVVK